MLPDAPAQVLHGQQAKADALAHHGEARLAEVDVGRQHGNAQAAALLDVLGHLAGLAQHAGEQRGHVLAGVVALEVGRLVGHHGVARRVGLVKGIAGKAFNLLEQRLGGGLVHAAAQAAVYLHLAALPHLAVEEHLPLPLQHVVLFLGHGPADNVGPAQGVARQIPENLHHLLLVDDAAAGGLQNWAPAGTGR